MSARDPHVRVHVKGSPLQPHAPLFIKHAGQQKGLRSVLARMRGLAVPYAILVHDAVCPFGVNVWPRKPEGSAIEELAAARRHRDRSCCCRPLVMYTGASA